MSQGDWTFLTNHSHVLICLSRNPEALLREVATDVGITEGAVHRIVSDLAGAGYLERTRIGRRNRYELRSEMPLRHPLESDHAIGEILDVVGGSAPEARTKGKKRPRDRRQASRS